MKYKHRSIFALTILFSSAMLSGITYAADAQWTGAYAGANVVHANGDSDTDLTSLGGLWSTQVQSLQDFTNTTADDSQNLSDTVFGLTAGYNYQLENNFVVGIEAGFNKLNMSESRQTGPQAVPLGGPPGLTFAFGNSVDATRSFSIRPKIGYAFNNFLVYLSSGVTWTKVEFESSILGSNGYSKASSESKTLTSLVWGGGVEYKFAKQWSGRVEYLKVNSDEVNYTSTYQAGSTFFPGYTERYKQDLDYGMLSLGLNYHF